MKCTAFFATILAILFYGPSVGAQTAAKIPHIGYLWLGTEGSDAATTLPGFKQGLRELGYREGGDIVIDYRYAAGSRERLRELIADLVASKVDIIVAPGVIVADAVKQATATIPVIAITADPVGSGLVASLARPGGNITGFSFIVTEFGGKWVELLHELLPHATRVAMLLNPSNAASRDLLQAVRQASGSLGLTLLSDEAGQPEDLPKAFDAIVEQKPDAAIIDTDALILSHRQSILAFASAQGLPAMYGLREFVDEGGLISYGPSPFDIWRRVAGYVDKILKGAKPADLPVQQPTKFELVVNLKTAAALGLAVPFSVLARADEVIE
jgi:putative tryptophan/tyrosine transport system substrate-binding protein